MEKNIKRYTVTTVLEYDREGDVIREERCEDTEYFEPESRPKLTFTPFDGYAQVVYPKKICDNNTLTGNDAT